MTPQPRLVKKDVAIRSDKCVTIRSDDVRTPWLIVLHGMAVIIAGLRKWLGLGEACDRCGRTF